MIKYYLEKNKCTNYNILSALKILYIPIQEAMCTIGPSLPKLSPAETLIIMPTDFTNRVHFPKYPLIIKPLKIVFICKITLNLN